MKRQRRAIFRHFSIQFVLAFVLMPLFAQSQRLPANYRQQPTNPSSAVGSCQNGGQFTGAYCSGERPNECGVLYQRQWTAICISGRCCTNPTKYVDDGWNRNNNGGFERGRSVCARYGGRYSRTVCKQASNCGPYDYSACISGYCCYLRNDGTKWKDSNNKRRQNQWEDTAYDEDGPFDTRRRHDGAHRPNGIASLCYRDLRFPRFMGHFCTNNRKCPPAFDQSTSKPIPIRIRCIEGTCCGESVWAPDGRDRGREMRSDDRTGRAPIGNNELIPNRLSEAFCYEGSRTDRQCLSKVDCRNEESCVNQLCCPRGSDEMNYSCGGLASNGSCGPNGQCVVGRKRLQCVSSGVCCECPAGQPQPGQCHDGYFCHNTGFCCPQCAAGGQMPFGSCNKGRCAQNFVCRPGNICCEDRFGELAIGTEESNENRRKRQRTVGGRNF
uniref:Uncharacterized protein n=1 Tax=Globodera rostochiensis TaxID=31243 RepID=A0A914HYW9_GLORO